MIGTQRFGSPRKAGESGILSGESGIAFIVTRKQWVSTLESSHPGFPANQPKQPKTQSFLIFSSVRLKGNSLLLARVMLK